MTTREKILDAAGSIFALRGFKDATIREIVQQAGVNQAAVNYHFRDKDNLYAECLRHGVEVAYSRYPLDGGADASASPEERLRAFIASALTRASSGEGSWHGRLMSREFAEPSATFVEVVVKPIVTRTQPYLQHLVGELNPRLDETQRWLCAHSLAAHCAFFSKAECHFAWTRPDWPTLSKELRMTTLSDHIWAYTLAGIRGMQ